MATAPGYRTHPEHHLQETRVTGRVSIAIDDVVVADSKDVVRVDEEGCPPRYYFSRPDVRMDLLERTPSVTRCPFKGSASYFTLDLFGKKFTDASWSYEDPYDEHAGLRGRIAFYLEKFPELELRHSASCHGAPQRGLR
jgi:uncharacterized protein (DUF427 family)